MKDLSVITKLTTGLCVLAILQACGGKSSSTGAADTSGGVGTIVSSATIEAGSCATGSGLFVDAIELQACDSPHGFEVAGRLLLEDDANAAYPGNSAIQAKAYEDCQAVFEAHVGIAFWDSELDLDSITPSASSWSDGDRDVVCLIVGVNDDPLTVKANS